MIKNIFAFAVSVFKGCTLELYLVWAIKNCILYKHGMYSGTECRFSVLSNNKIRTKKSFSSALQWRRAYHHSLVHYKTHAAEEKFKYGLTPSPSVELWWRCTGRRPLEHFFCHCGIPAFCACRSYSSNSTQYTVYSVQYTVYSVQYTVYSVQYTVYGIWCTVATAGTWCLKDLWSGPFLNDTYNYTCHSQRHTGSSHVSTCHKILLLCKSLTYYKHNEGRIYYYYYYYFFIIIQRVYLANIEQCGGIFSVFWVSRVTFDCLCAVSCFFSLHLLTLPRSQLSGHITLPLWTAADF